MFHTPTDSRDERSSSFETLFGFGEKPLAFPAALDLCRHQVPDVADCDGLRFAAAARRSTSAQAFRPAFATGDWRVFASFCIARRLPAGQRVLIPGLPDRALRFVVEGTLWQESAAAAGATARQSNVLQPGTIVGADVLFSDGSCQRDVRALEHSLILELPLPRHKELTAACPEIGFELLRAAGAVIAARGRLAEAGDELATS